MDVKTAARVFDVFEAFATTQRPMTVSDIAECIGVPQSSCFGLIKTAENRGFVYSLRKRGPLYPTRRMLDLCDTIARHDPLLERIDNELSGLRNSTDETVVLGKQVNSKIVLIAVYLAKQVVRCQVEVGDTREIHANSIGKAILGHLEMDKREELLSAIKYSKLTKATAKNAAELRKEIEVGRKRGWYESMGDSDPSLAAIAAPVVIDGQAYGLTVCGPIGRIIESRTSIAVKLLKTCNIINQSPRGK